MEYILQASAKVNLFLDITGDLPGGFHAVDTLMQSVDLYDTLFLRPAPDIRIDCPGVAQGAKHRLPGCQALFYKKRPCGRHPRAHPKGHPLCLWHGGEQR